MSPRDKTGFLFDRFCWLRLQTMKTQQLRESILSSEREPGTKEVAQQWTAVSLFLDFVSTAQPDTEKTHVCCTFYSKGLM